MTFPQAGAETSSTTLLWCVLYVTRYQEVQEAVREEVERVTGEERPALHHSLPYCQVERGVDHDAIPY